jgi:hypothetical protein
VERVRPIDTSPCAPFRTRSPPCEPAILSLLAVLDPSQVKDDRAAKTARSKTFTFSLVATRLSLPPALAIDSLSLAIDSP